MSLPVAVTEVSETASVTSEMALKQLEARYDAQSRQLEHISEVARENEATSARLADQNKVLKDEIRRLEKNQVSLHCALHRPYAGCFIDHSSWQTYVREGHLLSGISRSEHIRQQLAFRSFFARSLNCEVYCNIVQWQALHRKFFVFLSSNILVTKKHLRLFCFMLSC